MNADSKRRRQDGGVVVCPRRLAWAALCAGAVLALAGAAGAQATRPADAGDGPSYKVSAFVLSYGKAHPELPPLESFLQMPIALGKTARGYVAPRAGAEPVTVRLGALGGPQVFFASAIRRISEDIVAGFNRLGLVGIYVAPSGEDIDPKTGQDRRAAGNTTLRLVIWAATVERVRTLAAGERVSEAERINSPIHATILANSPAKAKSLLNKEELDRYVFLLNRHPGRRADVAITSGRGAGEVDVDYLITESRPWLAYAQASNTGTEATAKWRYRFGFIDNQLTGNDDILSVDYTTSCLECDPRAQTFAVSYEAPLCKMDRLRWRGYFQWGKFRANVTGVGAGENFTGYTWRAGGELIANVWQRKQCFLDVVAGLAWWKVYVDNVTTGISGAGDAFLPYVGLRLERVTELSTTLAQVTLEKNCPAIAAADAADYTVLGRTDPDPRWLLLRWDMLHSFFLEPLCNPRAWRDVTRPEGSTLAHEVAFMFRGQYSLNDARLIPQNEGTVGGLFTVRGYPESVAAGDTTLVGTAEYRLHLPRLFKPNPEPAKTPLPIVGTPFRWAPQTVYGRPDWDLIVRAFFDAGRAMVAGRQEFEDDYTLLGAGLGVELQFTPHFNVRCDWGVALRDLDSSTERVEAGDCRLHFVATIVY